MTMVRGMKKIKNMLQKNFRQSSALLDESVVFLLQATLAILSSVWRITYHTLAANRTV